MSFLARTFVGATCVALSGCFGSCEDNPGQHYAPEIGELTVRIASSSYSRVEQVSVVVRSGTDSAGRPVDGRQTVRGALGSTQPFPLVDEDVEVHVSGLVSSKSSTPQTDAGADGGATDSGLRMDEESGLAVLVERTARGRVPRGKSTLVIKLDAACELDKGAPVCGPGKTCSAGSCVPDTFTADDLQLADAPNNEPDPCPVNGPPEMILGTGDSTLEELPDGTIMPVYAGPQGGSHILLSVRTKNVRGNGTAILISGVEPVTGEQARLTSFVVPFAPATPPAVGCEVTGLRYETDGKTNLYGKTLDLNVSVREASGVRLSKTVRVNIGQ